MIVVVMGVSGVGKTTVGRALAERMNARFLDADDLHSRESIAKMARGEPLDDGDRSAWLAALRARIDDLAARSESAVVACSALKASHREALGPVRFVHLVAPREVVRDRLEHRGDHFMPASLLDSQLETLEPPRDALRVDATAPVEAQVDVIASALGS